MKNKVIASLFVVVALCMAWMMGDSPYQPTSEEIAAYTTVIDKKETDVEEKDSEIEKQKDEELELEVEISDQNVSLDKQESETQESTSGEIDEEIILQEEKEEVITEEISDNEQESEGTEEDTDEEEGENIEHEEEEIVPEEESDTFTVQLSITCHTLLNNMDLLDKNKHQLVPEDGVIYPLTEVEVTKGESVFDVLLREMQENRIHMEFSFSPMYNSVYIEGINNLYEFDGGELSGWMYKVNGWFPNYGCSLYELEPGDVIEWVYTCDLGRDVGGESALGGTYE